MCAGDAGCWDRGGRRVGLPIVKARGDQSERGVPSREVCSKSELALTEGKGDNWHAQWELRLAMRSSVPYNNFCGSQFAACWLHRSS